MFNLGPMELVVILVLALVVFGPGKLPDVGKALGKGLNEFRRASREVGSIADEPPSRPATGAGSRPVEPQTAAEEPAAEALSPAPAAPDGDPPPRQETERPV